MTQAQQVSQRRVFNLSPLALALAQALVAGTALAQQAPPSLDPGQLLQQEQMRRLPEIPAVDVPAAINRPSVPVTPVAPGGPAVTVKAYRFDGLTVMSADAANALVAPSIGKTLTFAQLQGQAGLVTAELARQGYLLAQVILPPQDVSEGVVVLKVIEGGLATGEAAYSITGDKRVSRDQVRGMLADAAGSGPVREQRLERGILIVNDLPGVNATVTLQPGAQPETASLNVALKDAPRIRGNASLDTFGNRYTGSIRAGLNVFLDNLSGRADQLSVSAVKALEGNSEFARAGYLTPVGYSGLQVGANISYLSYGIGRDLANLNTTGTAETAGLVARYPIIRSRLNNLYFSASADNKTLKSEAPAGALTDKDVDFYTIGLNGDSVDRFYGGGISSGSLLFGKGKLNLDALPAVKAADAASFNTQGSYERVNYSLNRLQTLTNSTMLQVSLSGQHADRNLDTSEKMSLGGPLGVRAYAAGEALGDRGFVASAEIRSVIAKAVRFKGFTLGDVQFAVFYDEGRIQQYVSPTSTVVTPNHYSLSGAGVGLNMGDAGVYDFRLIAARKLGSNPGLQPNGRDSDGDKNLGRVSALLNIYF